MDLDIKRNEDGIIKFRIKDGPIGYRYKVGGPVKFDASKIYFGSEDLSKLLQFHDIYLGISLILIKNLGNY